MERFYKITIIQDNGIITLKRRVFLTKVRIFQFLICQAAANFYKNTETEEIRIYLIMQNLIYITLNKYKTYD